MWRMALLPNISKLGQFEQNKTKIKKNSLLNLHFKNIKMVFKQISQEFGINFDILSIFVSLNAFLAMS